MKWKEISKFRKVKNPDGQKFYRSRQEQYHLNNDRSIASPMVRYPASFG